MACSSVKSSYQFPSSQKSNRKMNVEISQSWKALGTQAFHDPKYHFTGNAKHAVSWRSVHSFPLQI